MRANCSLSRRKSIYFATFQLAHQAPLLSISVLFEVLSSPRTAGAQGDCIAGFPLTLNVSECSSELRLAIGSHRRKREANLIPPAEIASFLQGMEFRIPKTSDFGI